MLKLFHPEGIPWPGTFFYSAISATGIFQRHYELVAQEIVTYGSTGTVLDVGTGPGWLLIKLRQQAPGMRVIGVDISPGMVAKARKNLAAAGMDETIEIKEGSASHLPVPDDSLDIVVSTGSVHHWKDPVAGLNEIHRALNLGGRALICDVLSDMPKSVSQEAVREFGRFKMMMLWIHAFEEPFYDQAGLLALGRASRFVEAEMKFIGVMGCLVLRKGLAQSG
jgi:ubiquinone/menaquinone biosynthesis C-methylase UbiE